jgi:hypothetical protein
LIRQAALTKRLGEGQTKLGQQQKLYEEVKADRNDYSKQLVLAHAEIAEMKRVFKDASRRVEALKEDIMAKDQALVKHHFEHHRVDTEKEALRVEVGRVQKQIQACEHIVSNQEVETRKLTAIASEAEAEFSRQRKELDAVRAERTLSKTFGGSCQIPLAAFATVDQGGMRLRAMVATPDGTRIAHAEVNGAAHDPEALGHQIAAALHAQDATAILAACRVDD